MKRKHTGGGNFFCVILHNIRSSYNVGSIFRSSDALGISKVYLGGYTPNPEKDQSICKTALGAEKYVPWETVWHTQKLITKLAQQGFTIVALEQSRKSVDLKDYMPTFPMALLVGNEVRGLSPSMLAHADHIVEISMSGKKESLNVSVAFGIAGYIISSKFKIQK